MTVSMVINVPTSPMSMPSVQSCHHDSSRGGLLMWKRLQPCTVARQDTASTVVVATPSALSSSTTITSSKPSTIGILVVGGRTEDGTSINVAELFEWSSKRWWKLPSLEQARCGCAVAAMDKTLHVFGGMEQQEDVTTSSSDRVEPSSSSSSSSLSTSHESFTLGGKAWMTETTPMPHARWYASAVSLPQHRDIVLLGGRDPSSWKELCSVDAYDTETKEWKSLSNMDRPRFGCGATRIGPSILLVAGGFDGNDWTTSCEIYDYSEDAWTHISDMPVAMQFCTASTLNDDYVIVSGQAVVDDDVAGEMSGSVPLLAYQVSTDEWTVLDTSTTNPTTSDVVTGSTMVAVNSNYVFAVGGTDPEGVPVKDTRIATNLVTVLNAAKEGGISEIPLKKIAFDDDAGAAAAAAASDDVTVATFKSASSGSRKSSMSHQSSMDDDVVPWWASPQKTRYGSITGASPLSEYRSSSSRSLRSGGGGGGPIDHIALVEEAQDIMSSVRGRAADDMSTSNHYGESVTSSIGTSSRSRKGGSRSPVPSTHKNRPTGRRIMVDSMETTDVNGQHVLYTGSIQGGRPYGKGKMIWENGDTYTGGFKEGQRHGKGCQSFRDGRQYEGRFVANEMEDANGQMTWKDGTIYVGCFTGGQRTGQGIQRFPTNVRYEGSFLCGKYSGHGVCVFADGSMYDGQWIQGKAHGKGKLIAPDGAILHNGLWQDDCPVMVQATS